MNKKNLKADINFRSAGKKLIWYLVLSIFAVTMVMPFIWMVSTSFKDAVEVYTQNPLDLKSWMPDKFLWQNYLDVFKVIPFLKFYFNSIFIALSVTLGVVLTSSLAGYAFSRLDFPGRDKIFFAYLSTMMIPGAVVIIPVFILMRYFGWIDSYKALIVPAIFTAYGTFMLRQFFMSLPKDLEDAAKIDGCGYLGIYFRIILPLSKPALATLTVFTFIGNWQSLLWPLLVTNSIDMFTVPIGLAYFQSQYYLVNWTLLMAASTMAIAPIIVVFLFAQKFFIEGIKLEGIKG
ncbi:MAG: carbohydrate ABC transporter permease [Candidatus Omnitrophica bacterium]|nr:carbohydrate ABC transporter permease [Candidatus Omnitrophota bacterium]